MAGGLTLALGLKELMKMHTLSFLALLLAVYAAPSVACDPSGAFGVVFGDKLPHEAKHELGSDGFVVMPSKPDAIFDRYVVFVDANHEIIEIDGIKQILPMPKSEADTPGPEQRAEGKKRAIAFVESYVNAQRSVGVSFEHQPLYQPPWQAIQDGVLYGVSGGNDPWTVEVKCINVNRVNRHAKRVLPELFNK